MELALRIPLTTRQEPEDDQLCPLVDRATHGDDKAMAELYDRLSPQVFGMALSVLRDRGAAEEAVLEVFVQVWTKATTHDPTRGSVRAWLIMLARSRAIDIARKRASHATREAPLDNVAEFADARPGPELACLDSERASHVRNALRSLPTEQRRAIEAAFYTGLSHSEVAETLGAPLGTIKTRIRRGLLNLREILKDDLEALA